MENIWENPVVIGSTVGAIVAAVLTVGGWVITRSFKAIWNAATWKQRVDDTLEELKEKVDKILDRLMPVPVANRSPLQLTDFGQTIAADINADKWADDLAATLKDQLRDKHPYEIQEFCLKYVQEPYHSIFRAEQSGKD